MKKKIFAAFLTVTPFQANAAIEPELYLGGIFDFTFAAPTQESDFEQYTLPHELSDNSSSNSLDKDGYMAQEAYIDILALGKSDTGMLYGATATLMLDSNTAHEDTYSYDDDDADSGATLVVSDSSKAVLTRRAYVFAEKNTLGRLELGDVEGPSKKMKFDAGYRFGGTGGINGDWWKYVNIPSFGLTYGDGVGASDVSDVQNASGHGNMGFIIRPDLPLSHGYDITTGPTEYDDTRTINRVSYYTPRAAGFQFGISYAGDSGDRGGSYYSNSFTSSDSTDVEGVIDWGVNYMTQGSNYGFALSFTGEYGSSEDAENSYTTGYYNQTDLTAYAIGGYGYYGNFEYSASVGNWGDSLMFIDDTLDSDDSNYREDTATYSTFGLGYQFAAAKFSAAIMSSEYREQKLTLTSFALDYRFTKYFTAYAEATSYDFEISVNDIGDNCGSIDNSTYIDPGEACENSGNVIMVGAKFEFGGNDNNSQILLDTSREDY